MSRNFIISPSFARLIRECTRRGQDKYGKHGRTFRRDTTGPSEGTGGNGSGTLITELATAARGKTGQSLGREPMAISRFNKGAGSVLDKLSGNYLKMIIDISRMCIDGYCLYRKCIKYVLSKAPITIDH